MKVWEALVQKGGFGAEPGQVQQGSGEGCGEGLGGFGAEPGQVQQELLGGLGAKPSQVQRVSEKVAEKVPEKGLGIFGAGPGQVPTSSAGFPALGFAAGVRKV